MVDEIGRRWTKYRIGRPWSRVSLASTMSFCWFALGRPLVLAVAPSLFFHWRDFGLLVVIVRHSTLSLRLVHFVSGHDVAPTRTRYLLYALFKHLPRGLHSDYRDAYHIERINVLISAEMPWEQADTKSSAPASTVGSWACARNGEQQPCKLKTQTAHDFDFKQHLANTNGSASKP